MNDADIKSKVNDSTAHNLHRVYSGRLYHIFKVDRHEGNKVAICSFWPSYQWFSVDRPIPEHRLDYYPLRKNCKEAFGKLTS